MITKNKKSFVFNYWRGLFSIWRKNYPLLNLITTRKRTKNVQALILKNFDNLPQFA